MNVQLIPVVELPSATEAGDFITASWPPPPRHTNPAAWEAAQRERHRLSGFAFHESVLEGSGLYQVAELTDRDIARLVELHVGDLPIAESCALFGGFVLTADGVVVLIPQCCGMLADIASYRKLVDGTAETTYFCLEGHPCPQAIRDGDSITIVCEDEWESFDPPAETVVLPLVSLREAVADAERLLEGFAQRIDGLGLYGGRTDLSHILIYTQE